MAGAHIALVASVAILHASIATAQNAQHLGTVHFETSCSPSVTTQFDRAVALLHSFEFGASIRAFNDVLAVDSTCAMAYWGIALSRWTNPMVPGDRPVAQLELGRQAVSSASRLAAGRPERERSYIGAVGQLYDDFEHRDQRTRVAAYERAMGDLVARQPADTEAKIFHALSLVASASPADKTYANQLKAGSILEELWAKQPNHPGLAHYIIHAYDSRNGTELWSHNDGIGHNGGIISYSAKGKQYVTVAVGWGSLVGDNFPKMFGGAYTSMPTDQGYLVTYTLP